MKRRNKKMKLNCMLNGSNALTELTKIHFTSFKTVHDIVTLKKKVDEEILFCIGQEKELIAKYGDKDEKGNPKVTNEGHVIFSNAADRDAFEKEVNALRDTDIEEVKMVTIKASDFRSQNDIPTPEQIIQLDGLIDFQD
jgi:hypothetical protein